MELGKGLSGREKCLCKGPEVGKCVLLQRNDGKASEFGAQRIKESG